jgi:RarD protein
VNARLAIIFSMLIFGSIGIIVRHIHLGSPEIAFLRAAIGSLFLFVIIVLTKQPISFIAIRKNLLKLILSGIALGLNWILLFQAFAYTTISYATLSYYCAPLFVILLAPIVLKEKLTKIKIAAVFMAMAGLFLILNVNSIHTGNTNNHTIGILYGLSGAVLYAGIILTNKFIKSLSSFEITFAQLIMAAIVLLVYVLYQNTLDFTEISLHWPLILTIGIIHTGIAYFLYFSAIQKLSGPSIAVLSYIDPISAIIMASIFLGETITIVQIVGGLLILGSTFLVENH